MPTTKSKRASRQRDRHWSHQKDKLRASALVKLGVTEALLAQTPAISHITKGVGGTPRIFDYLRGSVDPRARSFCELADNLKPTELNYTPIEAFCLAAKVPTKEFLGLLIEEVSEQAKIASTLLSKAAHPRVVQATIDSAQFADGVQDRKMLHQAEGFVPVPKTSVTVFRNAQIDARQQTVNATLAPVETSVRRIGERFLTVPPENRAPIEVVPEQEEDESTGDGE